MAKAQVRVLPSARNTVMVVDDQSTGRAILEQVVRSLDERVVVEGFARPVDAVVWACTSGSFVFGWEGARAQVEAVIGQLADHAVEGLRAAGVNTRRLPEEEPVIARDDSPAAGRTWRSPK